MTQNIIRSEVLRVDKENWIKQVRGKYFLCHLFIEKNYPVLHICALQKYVNLCFQYLVWPPFTFTFMHLADAFIQSDLHCNQVTGFFFYILSALALKLCDIGGFPPMNSLLRSFHNILIGLRSGLWLSKTLTLFFFNHSLVEWLVCLGLLSCCMTHVLLKLCS